MPRTTPRDDCAQARVVITLEASDPPTGVLETEAAGCRVPDAEAPQAVGERFTGWMELLAVLSAAVEAHGTGGRFDEGGRL